MGRGRRRSPSRSHLRIGSGVGVAVYERRPAGSAHRVRIPAATALAFDAIRFRVGSGACSAGGGEPGMRTRREVGNLVSGQRASTRAIAGLPAGEAISEPSSRAHALCRPTRPGSGGPLFQVGDDVLERSWGEITCVHERRNLPIRVEVIGHLVSLCAKTLGDQCSGRSHGASASTRSPLPRDPDSARRSQ